MATAGGVGEGGEGPVPAPPLEARDRGDFYSDTASARLCLVMVTCARSAPPSAAPPPFPGAAMEASGPGRRRRSPSAAMAG